MLEDGSMSLLCCQPVSSVGTQAPREGRHGPTHPPTTTANELCHEAGVDDHLTAPHPTRSPARHCNSTAQTFHSTRTKIQIQQLTNKNNFSITTPYPSRTGGSRYVLSTTSISGDAGREPSHTLGVVWLVAMLTKYSPHPTTLLTTTTKSQNTPRTQKHRFTLV